MRTRMAARPARAHVLDFPKKAMTGPCRTAKTLRRSTVCWSHDRAGCQETDAPSCGMTSQPKRSNDTSVCCRRMPAKLMVQARCVGRNASISTRSLSAQYVGAPMMAPAEASSHSGLSPDLDARKLASDSGPASCARFLRLSGWHATNHAASRPPRDASASISGSRAQSANANRMALITRWPSAAGPHTYALSSQNMSSRTTS